VHLNELQTPCALVDLDRFEANCVAMADKARRLGVRQPLPGLRLTSLSQEHGVVEGPGTAALQPGDRVRILPNHSCLAAACFDRLIVVRGSQAIADWRPVRGW
jgi:D-serine deaminase-like pyridoxal phosphate-dependent protein